MYVYPNLILVLHVSSASQFPRTHSQSQVPKRKPRPLDQPPKDAKPLPPPKKYAAFSVSDSRSIEAAFQKLLETETSDPGEGAPTDHGLTNDRPPTSDLGGIGSKQNTSFNDASGIEKGGIIKVPVNEDFLFDVDVETRELAPTYWLGPIYDVRRGSWFYQEGSTLRPCDENLAVQLEEGYLRLTPWRYTPEPVVVSDAKPKARPVSMNPAIASNNDGATESRPIKKSSADDLQSRSQADMSNAQTTATARFQLQTQRLFGQYMNSVVTYQDATVAWILTDHLLSRMSSTVYQRFAGGGHLGGVKVVRGHADTTKARDGQTEKTGRDSSPAKLDSDSASKQQEQASVSPKPKDNGRPDQDVDATDPDDEPRLLQLERQMSSFISSPELEDPAKEEEAVRKRDEKEIREDYKDTDEADQVREIEHLILVTHGIGQRLGLRMESINFIHDVNVLRKTLKSVYANSPDLQALNNEVDRLPKNCRIQVLPVVWRHLLDFPKQSFKRNNKEQDLTDADTFSEDEKYPSLDDITVDGVPAIRNLITDLALDILLYQSAYREHIAGIVQRESNRVYELFLQRNPSFHGKVSMIGHSLGSAILFDILCRQREVPEAPTSLVRKRKQLRRSGSSSDHVQPSKLALNFEVEDFYCLGSPVGLFQMLKGCRIEGRQSPDAMPARGPDALADPFLGPSAAESSKNSDADILSITVSSPKCHQLFNIFHPADPISYRMEPLISAAMSSLKPQPLPYTKRGIFGNTGQGISGIGTRVGQSVSGFWSSITTGVASSLLNRSLGLTDPQSLLASQTQRAPTSSNPNITSTINSAAQPSTVSSTESPDQPGEHPPTLIDSEIQTLYAGFEKRRRSEQSDGGRDLGESPEWAEADERAKRLRREEAKVRALNANGRVDFSIQE